MIEVARDTEGLRVAFLELMEEAADAPRREKTLALAQHAANSARLMESVSPQRSLSAGYYSRAEYLFWLERALDAAPGLWPRNEGLRADELAGLMAMENARAEFERAHVACPACGALNKRGAFRCSCGEELKARTKK
jgi:hypothetical protein